MIDYNPRNASWLLLILYVVGIGGMLSPYQSTFILLTPFNLLISLGLVLYYQEPKTHAFYSRFYLVMLTGFLVEVLGVNTGFPFGEYTYGVAFGPRILGTPPLIGVNWFIVVYGALMWVKKWGWGNRLIQSLLVGLMVVALDVIMEPVAIALGFWEWADPNVPLQNYISWAVIGGAMAYYLNQDPLPTDIQIAKWVFVMQALFFSTLYFGLGYI